MFLSRITLDGPCGRRDHHGGDRYQRLGLRNPPDGVPSLLIRLQRLVNRVFSGNKLALEVFESTFQLSHRWHQRARRWQLEFDAYDTGQRRPRLECRHRWVFPGA